MSLAVLPWSWRLLGAEEEMKESLRKKAEVKLAILNVVQPDLIAEFDHTLCPQMTRASFYRVVSELVDDYFLSRIDKMKYHVGTTKEEVFMARRWGPVIDVLISTRARCNEEIDKALEFLVEIDLHPAEMDDGDE